MGIDISTWRCRIGNSCHVLNAIGTRKAKVNSVLHDIKKAEYKRKTRGALFWIGIMVVITLSIVTIVTLNKGKKSPQNSVNYSGPLACQNITIKS